MNFEEQLERAAVYARGSVFRIVRDETITDDVLQRAKLNAWKYRKTFEGRSAFNSWFTTISRNEALMHLRYQRCHGGVHLSLDVDVPGLLLETSFADILPDPTPNPEARLLRAERREQLIAAILKLSPAQRREILLFSNGMCPARDARTGASAGARKRYRHRAYVSLRQTLVAS